MDYRQKDTHVELLHSAVVNEQVEGHYEQSLLEKERSCNKFQCQTSSTVGILDRMNTNMIM